MIKFMLICQVGGKGIVYLQFKTDVHDVIQIQKEGHDNIWEP